VAPAPRIAAIIATHQRRELVLEAVESALAQQRPADEILVVDDGSTDGSAEAIARVFGERVRVLREAHRGISAARNVGVRAASGELVAFLDSDDRWLPHHLATVQSLAARFPEAVLISTSRRYRFGIETPAEARCGDVALALLLRTEGVGYPTGVAVRRDAYLAAGGCDEQMTSSGEDHDLFLRLSLRGPMALISARTFVRRISVDSHSERHRRDGSYAASMGRTPVKLLVELERSSRPDAPVLRRAAGALLALEHATAALAAGEPAAIIRPHLAECCELTPELAADPSSIALNLRYQLPGWERADRRLRIAITLLRAWPRRTGLGYLRLAHACARALRPMPRTGGFTTVPADANRPDRP
jgi:GT2 family glycosyltransferase